MERARYGSVYGPLLTPSEFINKATPEYIKRGVFPYCEACLEVVHLYGVHTTNQDIIPRFDHADRAADADPLDDCVLAKRNSRFRGLEPDSWNDRRGPVMRRDFFKPENLHKFYAFCLALCRKGNLPVKKFRSMIHRADRKRVWAYADVPLWAIPYILLTLENFIGHTKDGREYEFHYVFNKPPRTNVSALWLQSHKCEIVKVFSNNGHPFTANDNPYPVSEVALIQKAGDISWITQGYLQGLVC